MPTTKTDSRAAEVTALIKDCARLVATLCERAKEIDGLTVGNEALKMAQSAHVSLMNLEELMRFQNGRTTRAEVAPPAPPPPAPPIPPNGDVAVDHKAHITTLKQFEELADSVGDLYASNGETMSASAFTCLRQAVMCLQQFADIMRKEMA